MLSNTVNHLVPSNVSNEGENWKRASRPEYSHKYLVSDQGRVFNLDRGVLVSQMLAGKPQYFYTNLHVVGLKRKLVRVHKIVGETWLLDYTEGSMIDHKDRNKLNNNLYNLRSVDRRLNANNKDDTKFVYYKGFHLPLSYAMDLEFGSSPERKAAHAQIYKLLYDLHITFEEALACYYNQQHYGKVYKVRFTLIDGRDVNLFQWCTYHSLNYKRTRQRIQSGWSSVDLLYNFKPTLRNNDTSIEIRGIWFPTKQIFIDSCAISEQRVKEYLALGRSYEEIYSMQPTQPRVENVTLDTGIVASVTVKELANLIGSQDNYVVQLLNQPEYLTFQSIYDRPKQRIIKHKINGVVKRNSKWAEHFEIPPKMLNAYLSQKLKSGYKRSMKDALTFYGVDTADMDIQPY